MCVYICVYIERKRELIALLTTSMKLGIINLLRFWRIDINSILTVIWLNIQLPRVHRLLTNKLN